MRRSSPKRDADAPANAERMAQSFDLARAPGLLFRLLDNRAAALFQSLTAEYEITARQFGVLLILFQNGRMRQTQLGQAIGIDRSTLAEMLQRLADRSLVLRRTPPDDRRITEVQLSAAGRSLLLETIEAASKAQTILLSCLTHQEQTQLIAFLVKMLNSPRRARERRRTCSRDARLPRTLTSMQVGFDKG